MSWAPREGWLYLRDDHGNMVAKRPLTLVPTTEDYFGNPPALDIYPTMSTHVARITVDLDNYSY